MPERILPRSLTVYVDTREKYPLLFPATMTYHSKRLGVRPHTIVLRPTPKRLDTGDYLLARWPTVCIVERKASSSELWKNLMTDDFPRAEAALVRLAEGCRHPILLLDMTPAEALRRSEYCPEPARALDQLYRMVIRLNLHLLWAGNCRANGPRRALGEQVVRLMLAAALKD